MGEMNTTLFTLPDLGEGLTEAEVREWYAQEGETLTLDQPMISVETAKAVVDIPSPFSGTLTKRFGQPGDAIKTGHPLAEFAILHETNPKHAALSSASASDDDSPPSVVGCLPSSQTVVNSQTHSSHRAIPAVRALAKQLGVNLDSIVPSRPDGVITAEDVKQAAAATTHPEALGFSTPLNSPRRHMAKLLSQAHQSVVPVTLTEEAILPDHAAQQDTTLELIQALITACRQEPALNAHFCGKTLTYKRYDTINLGLALDTPHGLYLPVLKSVDTHTPQQWRTQIDQFKHMAAKKQFSPELLREATLVLSNFGSIGGRYATPMVIPPTVAILGVGRRYEAVVADDNHQPTVKPCLPLSLTVDHRAITGGEAARFMRCLANALAQANLS